MGRAEQIPVPVDPPLIHRDHLIRVFNKHPEMTLTGRWNGKDFKFKPTVKGEPATFVDLPLPAAAHIFGFGEDDVEVKMRAFNNTGLLHRLGSYDACIAFLREHIKFDTPPPLVEVAEDDPRRRQKPKRAKATDASPSVNGGGEEGEGDEPSPPDSDDPEGDGGIL